MEADLVGAAKIAEALSKTLGGQRLSRNVVVGVYDRHPELRRSHPLGGSGAAKQRAHAEARAKMTQEEREAKAREREAKAKEREERKPRSARRKPAARRSFKPASSIWCPTRRGRRPRSRSEETAIAYDEASRRVPLMELDRGDCRWPVNDPEPKVEEYLFCGHKAKLGSKYCSHHAKRSVIPIEKTEKTQAAARSRRRQKDLQSIANGRLAVRVKVGARRPRGMAQALCVVQEGLISLVRLMLRPPLAPVAVWGLSRGHGFTSGRFHHEPVPRVETRLAPKGTCLRRQLCPAAWGGVGVGGRRLGQRFNGGGCSGGRND